MMAFTLSLKYFTTPDIQKITSFEDTHIATPGCDHE